MSLKVKVISGFLALLLFSQMPAYAEQCNGNVTYKVRDFYDSWGSLWCDYQFAVIDYTHQEMAFQRPVNEDCHYDGQGTLQPGLYIAGGVFVGVTALFGEDNIASLAARFANSLPLIEVKDCKPITISCWTDKQMLGQRSPIKCKSM